MPLDRSQFLLRRTTDPQIPKFWYLNNYVTQHEITKPTEDTNVHSRPPIRRYISTPTPNVHSNFMSDPVLSGTMSESDAYVSPLDVNTGRDRAAPIPPPPRATLAESTANGTTKPSKTDTVTKPNITQGNLHIIQENDTISRALSVFKNEMDSLSTTNNSEMSTAELKENEISSTSQSNSYEGSHVPSMLFRSQPSVISLAPHSHLGENTPPDSMHSMHSLDMGLKNMHKNMDDLGVINPVFDEDDFNFNIEYQLKTDGVQDEKNIQPIGFEEIELETTTYTAAYDKEAHSEDETDNLLDAKEATEDENNLDQLEWDVFREITPDFELIMCEGFFKIGQKMLKILFVLLTFLIILGTLMVNKLGLLYAASNANPHVGFRKHGGDRNYDYGRKFNDSCGVPVCYDNTPDQAVDYKDREVVRWLWCLMLCLLVPYVFTFILCMFKIIFKKKRNPKARAIFFVLGIEVLHSGGMFALLFMVLPHLDVMRSVFLMNATMVFPSFMKMLVRPKKQTNTDDLPDNGGFLIMDVIGFLCQMSAPVLWIAMSIDAFSSQCGFTSCDCSSVKRRDVCTRMDVTSLDIMFPNNYSGYSTYGLKDDPTYRPGVFDDSNVTVLPTTMGTTTTIKYYDVNVTQIGPLPECLTDYNVYLIPVALILVSLSWWENFVDGNLRLGKLGNGLRAIRNEVKIGRTKIYALVSIIKIIITVGLLILFVAMDLEGTETTTPAERIKLLFTRSSFQHHKYANNETAAMDKDWLIVFAAVASSALLGYFTTTVSIQAKVQRATFSLAATLATPFSIGFGLWICNDCRGSWDLAKNMGIDVELFWDCHGGYENLGSMVQHRYITLIGFAWWVGQMILVRYIWSPQCERLTKSKRLFVQPLYCGVLLEQSLTLNRARDDLEKQQETELPPYIDLTNEQESDDIPYELEYELRQGERLYERQDLSKPMIFVCVTMWHENEPEMIQMLKSVLRLDKDQCARRLTRDHFRVRVPDYYDFEVHIFFDDAFDKHDLDDYNFKVGPFVKTFVTAINHAAKSVHGHNVEIDDPVKMATPYGGKLIYALPGENTITIHMKDIVRIRHRKRWSQVMYLYYLLGYRLWGTSAERNTKELIANNTFILTLDGDIDFHPPSVLHLVDLMRRDIKVGAACGRIHPKGSGPMVWYQQFEYAISHWLQKSAEHVLGCVLCSPGCFSLFRASALMDDNVMKKYSKRAQEAVQYVQYDQGEDRWLCTLLLQQGYKVEYSAAADALTFAPEGFNEFFNQRRRWTPSTFANIMDLLANGMDTVRKNENINILYIVYQGGLFVSSILGPGTIVLMIAGAFESALGMSSLGAFFLVMAPLFVFFVLGFFAKSSIQLAFAAVLSGLFSISQIIVLVGIILEIAEEGICSPTSMFMIFVVGVFFISALLHPREFFNILHGIIYYLAIPTMYLLLIIYSLVNLNVVSWGTREITKTTTEKEQEREKSLEKEVQKAKKNKNTFGLANFFGGLASLGGLGGADVDGWTWSCGHCCRMMCCPRPGQSATDARITGLSAQTSALHNELATLRHTIQELKSTLPVLEDEEKISTEDNDDVFQSSKKHNPDTYIREDSDADSEIDDPGKSLLNKQHTTRAKNILKGIPQPLPLPNQLPPPPVYATGAPIGGIPVQSYPAGALPPFSPLDDDHAAIHGQAAPLPDKPAPEADETGIHPPVINKQKSVMMNVDGTTPPWTFDKDIGTGKTKTLYKKEEKFWKDLIARYLYPLIHDKIHQEKVAKHLRELRNKAVIGFFLIDVLFIVLIQSIQLANDNIASAAGGGIMIRWNCSDPITGQMRPQLLEPTGIAFLAIFGVFMVIQFIAMMFHRLFSLVQIVSTTTILQKKSKQGASVKDLVELTKDMAKLEEQSVDSSSMDEFNMEDSQSENEQQDPRGRSRTVLSSKPSHGTHTYKQGHIIDRIEKSMKKKTFKTMDRAFARTFLALGDIAHATPHHTLQGTSDMAPGAQGRRVSNSRPWNDGSVGFNGNIQFRNKSRPAIPEAMKMSDRNPSVSSEVHRDRLNSTVGRAQKGTVKGATGTERKHGKAIENVLKRKSTIFGEAKANTIRAKYQHTLRDIKQAKKELAKYVDVPVTVVLNTEEEATYI